MSRSVDKKYGDLCNFLKSEGKLAVAFSAGVDSTLLLRTVIDAVRRDRRCIPPHAQGRGRVQENAGRAEGV